MATTKPEEEPQSERQTSSPAVVPVVGIGSSAGGLRALEQLLPAIPSDSGLAFVIVQHLAPDHESSLTALLRRLSPIPVTLIQDRTPIEANHVYVIPPNASLTMVDDRLAVAPPVDPRALRTPVDGFFISLAAARGERTAGVILSGSGSDGTLGLRAIKEHGGLTIAQEGAEYDGMMRSAVRSGMVDVVLPVAGIPAKLVDHFRRLDAPGPLTEIEQSRERLAQVCAVLRARTGHDFSGYKDKTVARRVQRRMQVLQLDSVPEFLERLRKDPAEVEALLQDLLIGVTNFFRDPQAFAALEKEVIPHLFEGKGADDTVRVWVPACSTGEEAYSIAILLREHMSRGQSAPKLQIFASDIDEPALAMARLGRYPAAIAGDISPDRLERYFVREDGTYRITSDLREICLFSGHNLLRDAPFSRLDLISCRNLLIYLTPELQNRVIPLFHYALNKRGYLVLGSSENLTRHGRLFSTVDKPHRIFRRRSDVERRLPEFPLTAPDSARRDPAQSPRRPSDPESLQALADRQLLDRFAPAYVIINAEGDLLHGSARTGKYLELPPGIPKTDIYSMARQGLRPDLRAGVHKAASSGQTVVQKNVLIGTNGGRQLIDLVIQPLRGGPGTHDPLFMVLFQDIGGIRALEGAEAPGDDDDLESASLRQIELELRSTRERLQTTTEELESANEELKSGNEELSSMNEELQSANEELETSKEELQSINEELQTVNAELNARVEELSRANSDIANLLESTQIATVFLDRNFHIKSFTPAAKDVFRLVESDTGRPIAHVRARFRADTVQEDAERVMRTLSTIERQIESTDTGTRYVMRMMPYRTVDNVIGGVVVTFVDVTRIEAAEARIGELTRDVRDRMSNLETLLDVVPVGILILPDARQPDAVQVNRHGAELLGDGTHGEGPGPRRLSRSLRLVQGGRELAADEQPLQRASRTGQPVGTFEGELLRVDGKRRDVMVTATPLLDEGGKVHGAIAAIVDISERKRAEAHQQVLLHELQHRVKNIIATVSALAGHTLKPNITAAEFVQAFQGRLRGMARTHELLSRSNWTGAPLGELVETAVRSLTARGSGAFAMQGPEVMLTPSAAATLGMVLYELATNAAKYGALAKSGGRLDVAWQIAGSGRARRIELTWVESAGADMPKDFVPGFGLNFVTRSIEYELQGKAGWEPAPGGLRWTIEFPVSPNVQNP